ncbi:MAG: hypothetical protein H0Z39_00440 [Peptococcaceae bacterium]|nr:hypothetical protein [Peptococcaceae bacterium]
MTHELTTYDKYITYTGKTQPRLSIFEHSNDVFQVAEYLITKNMEMVGDQADIVRVGALTHDVGKIEQDVRGDQWVHSSYSSKYLDDLLDDQRFRMLLQDNGINLDADRRILLKIAEEHHSCCPSLLVEYKAAILVSIADVIASCLERGFVGNIQLLLASNPYTQINMELTHSLGFTEGLSGCIHRIDLPAHSVEDVLLANMIFQQLAPELIERGLDILLQKRGTLWVVGDESQVREALTGLTVNPKMLYEALFNEKIFDTILSGLPPELEVSSVKYLLVNEAIAIKLATALYGRRSIREILERYDLSDTIEQAAEIFRDGLENGIKSLWQKVREKVASQGRSLKLPTHVVPAGIQRGEKLAEYLKAPKELDRKTQKDLQELLKLFDYSSNGYRSLTNVVLELRRMEEDVQSGVYNLQVAEFALLNGSHVTGRRSLRNKSLCPICRCFPQQIQGQGLITGSPKTDSVFQTHRKTHSMIRVCQWCFTAGYMDLPIARVTKPRGQSVNKQREYLLINSPLAKERLQKLIDVVAHAATVEEIEEESHEATEISEQDSEMTSVTAELTGLQALIGEDIGADMLSVYGRSRKRLSQLKGFALPTLNRISSIVGVRIPVERLVGEEGISGAVKRELIKATMYDFYRLTGGSLHYVTPTDYQFSVFGEEVTLDEMRRASLAYRIADANRRKTKKSYVLNQGLFLELLNNPRRAVTLIWRKKHRDSFSPGADKVKEVIDVAEQIATQGDWKFQLGLKIVRLLVENGWCPRAKGFWKTQQEQYTGVELVKWIQSIKMVRDADSARSWGTRLLNAYRREHERGANQELVKQVLELVEEIISTCEREGCPLGDFSRTIADMDLYLLFYYNHYKGGESE